MMNQIQLGMQEHDKKNWKLTNAIGTVKCQLDYHIDNIVVPSSPTSSAAAANADSGSGTKISSEEEFRKLEEKLSTEVHFEEVKNSLNKVIVVTFYKQRIHEALYILICTVFLMNCNWSGERRKNQKISFCDKVNVLRLFQQVSSHERELIDPITINEYIKTKLRNATSHAGIKNTKQTVARKTFTKPQKK